MSTVLLLGACGPSYLERIAPLQGPELYRVAMTEFENERWSNAIAALERLSRELPARDALLPIVYYRLGQAHVERLEYLLAAQSFQRISETFPNDTLADDGLLQAGRSYAAMWRKPALDQEYGQTALSTFQTLLAVYPNSDVRVETEEARREVMTQLAEKDYNTGVYYMRQRAYDSAILYLEDVVERYPETPIVRQARLRLVEVYERLDYEADKRETCEVLRRLHPDDPEVRDACGAAAAGGRT